MADIALAQAARVRVVESILQATLPAAEAIVAGAPVRIDSNGKFANGNATTATEANIYGIATSSAAAGEALTALKLGVLDGFTLAGAYGSAVYVSDTDARIADSAGSQINRIGTVIPAWAQLIGTAADKLLFVDAQGGGSSGGMFVVTDDLMAATVDEWVFVAAAPCQLIAIQEVHSVVGGSGAVVTPRKVTAAGTAAPGDAAGATVIELTAAALDLTSTINVVVSTAVVTTDGANVFAAGDKLGHNMNGTLTGLVGKITYTFAWL